MASTAKTLANQPAPTTVEFPTTGAPPTPMHYGHVLQYCSSACQKAHWLIHKLDCRSPHNKTTWVPEWSVECRTPTFIGDGIPAPFGGKQYPYGNISAFDILRLGANEGEAYASPLRLSFAASGDLRNAVQTVARLPQSYEQPIDIMNDRDFGIVARNAIILLVALTADDIDEASDCIIHIWYSSSIRKSHVDLFNQRIRPLIQSVCDKVKDKPATTNLGKTATFEKRSVKLILEKRAWDKLVSFMDASNGLTIDKANEIRKAVTFSLSRIDLHDCHFLFQSPSHRVARHRFRQDDLLLPFGAQQSEHCEVNPTFFRSPDGWPMNDSVDPLLGWSLQEVDKTPFGPATPNIYGKLFYHIQSMLERFMARMSKSTVAFQSLQVDAETLPDYLDGSFDRIDASNISDCHFLGVYRTVELLAPLLRVRAPSINPHATLITLFLNTVQEYSTQEDNLKTVKALAGRIFKYLPPPRPIKGGIDPFSVMGTYAQGRVQNYDDNFERFVKKTRLAFMPLMAGAAIKDKHTIIEKWPYRLKLDPEQERGKEELYRLITNGVTSRELYLEWKRTQDQNVFEREVTLTLK
ncbi:hypothetical protein FOVSG1_013763 [Fusarium oxysporum f. sp. vasinfectum]